MMSEVQEGQPLVIRRDISEVLSEDDYVMNVIVNDQKVAKKSDSSDESSDYEVEIA